MRYNYSAWQVGEVLLIKNTKMLTFYIPLKLSPKMPDLRTFSVTLICVIKDVVLPGFSLLACS